jgi:hypothetical protein
MLRQGARPQGIIPLPDHPVPNDAVVLPHLHLELPVNDVGDRMIQGSEQLSVLAEPPFQIPSLENEEITDVSDEGGRDVISYIPPSNAKVHALGAKLGTN